jgi:hypothetical protein
MEFFMLIEQNNKADWELSATDQDDWKDNPGSIRLVGTMKFTSIKGIAEFICTKHWTPFIFKENVRHGDNFIKTDLLVFDSDDGFPLEDVKSAIEELGWLGAICLSKSHQKEKHEKPACDRFRLILALDAPITDREGYKTLWFSVAEKLFLRDPNIKGRGRYWIDDSAKDVARFYYRCSQVYWASETGSPLASEALIRDFEWPHQQSTPTRDIRSSYTTNDEEYKKKGHLFNRVNGYLNRVPGARSGDNGNSHTYKIAAKLVKDFGLSSEFTSELLLSKWNHKCSPRWTYEDLGQIVRNASKYAVNSVDTYAKQDEDYRYWNTNRLAEECGSILEKEFALFRERSGEVRIFRRQSGKPNEVVYVSNEEVLEKVLHDGLTERYQIIPKTRTVSSGVELWIRNVNAIDKEPLPFTFDDDDRLTFKQLSFSPIEGPYPNWEQFLIRLKSSRCVFMAFVWSIFEERNKSRQYLYLHGDGEDGKSTVIRVIADVFGSAKSSINGNHLSRGDKFLSSQYYGKRVLVYPDCKNSKFGMSEFVRNVTSGDEVPIEFKGKTPFSSSLYLKLLVGSNLRPEISGQNADVARLIYIEVEPSLSKDDTSWEE